MSQITGILSMVDSFLTLNGNTEIRIFGGADSPKCFLACAERAFVQTGATGIDLRSANTYIVLGRHTLRFPLPEGSSYVFGLG